MPEHKLEWTDVTPWPNAGLVYQAKAGGICLVVHRKLWDDTHKWYCYSDELRMSEAYLGVDWRYTSRAPTEAFERAETRARHFAERLVDNVQALLEELEDSI